MPGAMPRAVRWRGLADVSLREMTMKYGPEKQSKPEKVGSGLGTAWRIRRHDGELVGWFNSHKLAQESIDKSPWLL